MRRTSLTMEPQNPLFITFAMSTPRWDQGSSWKDKVSFETLSEFVTPPTLIWSFWGPKFQCFFLTKVALFWFFWQRWLFSYFSDKGGSFLGQQWLAVRWERPHEDCRPGISKPPNIAMVKNQEPVIVSDIDQVPNIVVNNQVPWDGWNHLDFLYAIDIDQYQNDDLLAALAMYPIEWIRNI